MKIHITIFYTVMAMLIVASCATSARYANSEQQFTDGIYYSATTTASNSAKEAKNKVDDLINKTKQTFIILQTNDNKDTIILPSNIKAQVIYNKKNNNKSIAFINKDKDLFNGRANANPYNFSLYRPFDFGTYYNPYYYNGIYNPYLNYYNSVYNPYFGRPIPYYYGYDPYYYSPYYSSVVNPYYYGIWGDYYNPYYYDYYGIYDPWYTPIYTGVWEPKGESGKVQNLGNNQTWGARSYFNHSSVKDGLGAYTSNARRVTNYNPADNYYSTDNARRATITNNNNKQEDYTTYYRRTAGVASSNDKEVNINRTSGNVNSGGVMTRSSGNIDGNSNYYRGGGYTSGVNRNSTGGGVSRGGGYSGGSRRR